MRKNRQSALALNIIGFVAGLILTILAVVSLVLRIQNAESNEDPTDDY